ncbi:MAG: hypothetical protein KR126chlam6_00657, partial [Candidatus Anoxychlamydiales bacterium]|nr:hypothetical protein [Candidatus Anoxychlamydiales bacterium]
NILTNQSSDNNSSNKWTSEKKIETLLHTLFLKPLILETSCVPLAPDEERLSERHQLIEKVIQKDWVRNNMQIAVKQLQETYKRLEKEGHQVSKLFFALDLSLSYRLLQDPFSYSDRDFQDLVTEKLEEIFRPFKDELLLDGIDLKLLLP